MAGDDIRLQASCCKLAATQCVSWAEKKTVGIHFQTNPPFDHFYMEYDFMTSSLKLHQMEEKYF